MKISFLIKEPWPRIIGIPIVGVIAAWLHNGWPLPFESFLQATVFTAVMWNGDYFIIKFFRKRWPSLDATHKRILTTILAVCTYNILADYALCYLFNSAEESQEYWGSEMASNLLKNLMLTAIVGTLYEAGYFFSKWKKQTIEMEQLRNQQLRSELSVLKNQISPHFLFNSLNTLVTLIHENQDQAAKFTEKLSEVYRYILQFKDKELVRLSTEIKFSKAFIYLLKMRFEEGLEIEINLDIVDQDRYVAPLTIQMLIENAVKHNVVSKNQPLHIKIYSEQGKSLIVKNNLQHKPADGKSTHTGLENIQSRYALLTNREVDIIKTQSHFMVALPLVELVLDDEGIYEEVKL
ncbi:histidine kinase [Cryomorphaceae bacterium 1068]|nr:histidine kinase [Cryomorphaceae bacterium 1068]